MYSEYLTSPDKEKKKAHKVKVKRSLTESSVLKVILTLADINIIDAVSTLSADSIKYSLYETVTPFHSQSFLLQ